MPDENIKQPKALTSDDAWQVLRHTRCIGKDGDAICPICRTGGLTINGGDNGTSATCDNGCIGVEGYLQVAAAQRTLKGEHVDRTAVLRTKLALAELAHGAKHGKMGDKYVLHLIDGRQVDLGNAAAMMSQTKFRAAFLPQVGRNCPRYKPAEWDEVVELVEQVCEQIETSSDQEETIGWVLAATSGQLKRNVDTSDSTVMFDLLGEREPPAFLSTDDRIHIRLPALQAWLSRQAGRTLAAAELGGRLSAVGLRPVQLAARGGEPSTVRKARYWSCPHGSLL